MSKIIRLSHTLKAGDARYPGNPDVRVESVRCFDKGDTCSTFMVEFFNHNGTHIDFPKHFVRAGRAMNDYSPNELVFSRVMVIALDLERGAVIDESVLGVYAPELAACEAVLLKTGYQKTRGTDEFAHGPYFSPEGAAWFRRSFPRLHCLGLDTLSITSFARKDVGAETHRVLLGPGADGSSSLFVIEDMDLSALHATSAISELIVAPWFIEKLDGGPCTVFAKERA